MSEPLPTRVADLPAWIIDVTTREDAPERMLDGVCRVLLSDGLPLLSVSVAVPAIHPQFRGAVMNWWRDRPVDLVIESGSAFEHSPIRSMQERSSAAERWILHRHEGCALHPALEDLRRQGGTDYAMFFVPFSPGTVITGTAIAIVTDRDGGFEHTHISIFARLMRTLGLGIYRLILRLAMTQALNSYLGPMTGAKILAGHTRRGEGETIAAAILLADLAGFTALTDREDPIDVVRWLNEHLEAIGDPVTEQGGEILKFMGDGLLAVFPTTKASAKPCAACEAALRAAEQAIVRNNAVNAGRAEVGEPQLVVHIALHFGEVVYGNVGTPTRLDFTSIGRAVNETARIERLSDETGHPLLASDTFAERCSRPFKKRGSFTLRGVEAPRTVLTPA